MKSEERGAVDLETGYHANACLSIEEVHQNDVAIIGISAKFSNAENKDEFWHNLITGKDCIKPFPQNRIADIAPFCEYLKIYLKNFDFTDPESYAHGGYLDDISGFDYTYFQISPNDAALMDPCQRLFLQGCVEAIHDAGYGGQQLSGSRTGVYAAFSPDFRDFTYKYFIKRTDLNLVPLTLNKNITCSLPAWIAYLLDLKGPNMCIDTGCSAALVALHLACQALRSGECTYAIAGGVKIDLLPIKSGLKIGIESDDGYCRAFDEGANGTGIGEGVGVVLLKSLHHAVQDGDDIYAVIKGSAVNQDGKSRGITLPNADAQADVILAAMKDANISPETIDYIEAHGTATKVGDPIEIEGICNAFQRYTNKKQFCAISSVKSNIGHLYEASGMASVIKAALCLKNRKIPKTLHFNQGNRNIPFEETPVFVNRELMEWHANGHERRCGVSAFGITGTNAHIILEEAPPIQPKALNRGLSPQVFAISGTSPATQIRLVEQYIAYLSQNRSLPLSDLCYSNNLSNSHFDCRRAFMISDTAQLLMRLKDIHVQLSKSDMNLNADCRQNQQDDETSRESMRLKAKRLQKRLNGSSEHWNRENLGVLATMYEQGCPVDWKRVYKNQGCTRIQVPIAGFEEKKCWLKPDPRHVERVKYYKQLFFEQAWIKTPIISNHSAFNGPVIVISETDAIPPKFLELLQKKGGDVRQVGALSQKVLASLTIGKLDDKTIDIIFWNCIPAQDAYSTASLDRKLETGLLNYFSALKTIAANNLFGNVRMTLITNNAFSVPTASTDSGNTVVIPENSAIYGLLKTARREFPESRLKGIDTDSHTDLNLLIDELTADGKDLVSAFRKNEKFIQQFGFLDLPAKAESCIRIKKNGVYIITGGTGGLGIAFAEYLAGKKNCRIALISRSGKVKNAFQEEIIHNIETSGSTIFVYKADCANPDQMALVIRTIRETYGRIDGVLHCAGVIAENLIKDQSEQKFWSIISAKVHGAVVLDTLTADDGLDFFILFSSVASVFPAMMQGDYAAANVFLDAFAQWRNRKRKHSMSINWVAWKEIGMAFDVNTNIDTIFKALDTENGLMAFDTLLKHQVTNVFVGRIHYAYKNIRKINDYGMAIAPQIADLIESSNGAHALTPATNTESESAKPELTGRSADEPEYSHLEIEIAKIWSHQLGYQRLDIYDSFYDLGGDSILAVNIIQQVNNLFQTDLKLSDMIDNPNIHTMAQMVAHQMRATVAKHTQIRAQATHEPANARCVSNSVNEIPATWQQRYYYELQSIHSGTTQFNNHMSFLINGGIDIAMLQKAFQQLIDRHEILRTCFRLNEAGQLIQVIKPEMVFEMAFEENVNLKKTNPMLRYILPFDLHRTPLMRAFLIQLKADEHLLIIDIHHIISDGVTMPIITDELLTFYQGHTPVKNSYQYSDYARYQSSDTCQSRMKEQKVYWMALLQDRTDHHVKLSYDFPESDNETNDASHCAFAIYKAESEKIRNYCNHAKITVFMLFVAAIKLTLWKQTHQKRIVVGTYSNGRIDPAAETCLGLFVNKILLVDEIREDMRVSEFLQNIKKTLINAMENRQYPFEQLAKDLDLKRTVEKNAVFNVFVLNNVFSKKKYKIKELRISPGPVANSNALTTNYDLTFIMIHDNSTIRFAITYLKDRFKPETIQQTGNHLRRILSSTIDFSNLRISDL